MAAIVTWTSAYEVRA